MLIALLVLGGCSTSTPHAYDPAQEIEYRYSAPGPFAVQKVALPPASGQPDGMAFIPIGHDGPAPVVVWQNGTGEPIATYDAIARHLASWGLAVLGSNDRQMGSGETAISLIGNAVLWSATPGHPLHGRIDAESFALVGSSQGAVSTINAHTRFALGRCATTLAIHGIPSRDAIDFFRLDIAYDASGVTAPTLVLTGTEDEFISPVSLNQLIFDGLSPSTLNLFGVARGADHIELAGDAGRFRGYLTAWLAFQLQGDTNAARAFLGPAEMVSNPTWMSVNVTGL